jgi:hypothetical protein
MTNYFTTNFLSLIMKFSDAILEMMGFKRYHPKATINEADESKLRRMGFKQFKKTEPVWAIKADKPFTVDTLEGDNISGKAGDYLCVGAKNEMWPIDAEVFNQTYEEV